jgi:hypothetical protein
VDYAGTAIVGDVDLGDTLHIYAIGQGENYPVIQEVGTAIGTGAQLTVPLDYTGFDFLIMGVNVPVPESTFAVTENAAGMFSQPSVIARSGLLGDGWPGYDYDITLAADRTTAQIIITNVPATGISMVLWNSLPAMGVQAFTGSGTFTIVGINPDLAFVPTILGLQAGRIQVIYGDSEAYPMFPYSRRFDTPGSREREAV